MAQPLSHNRYPTELTAIPSGHERENVRQSPNDQSLEPGYEWVALSVTTVGALLASLQGSSLIIALPDVLTGLGASFLTLMWVLLGYLLITTALVPVVGRAADIFGRKRMYVAGFAVFTVGSLLGGLAQQRFDWLGSATFVLGMGCLLLGVSLVAFPLLPSSVVTGLFVVAAVGLMGFLFAEVHASQPMLDLGLFRNRLFGFASLAGGLNGLARGAVLFVLIFFLQGPYGQDPLMAGLSMIPFGAAFLLVGPLSGYLSDKYGSRLLSTLGLLVSAAGLLGLTTIVASTPYWVLAVYMILMGGGSGLFSSPNVNALMSTVAARQRGSASGINVLVGNTGQMLSIALAFPLVLSRIPQDVMFRVFLYGGGMGDMPEALLAFEQEVHEAFLVSFGITLVAALASALRPSQSTRELHAEYSLKTQT